MLRKILPASLAWLFLMTVGAAAAELAIVSGAVGRDLKELRLQLDRFEAGTGHKVTLVSMPPSTTDQFGQYKLWLAARNADIDVYRTDIIWAPQLAAHFVDLTPHVKDVVGDHFESIIASQTVGRKLVALPMFTDAPALYYRRDLLEKHGANIPRNWNELTVTAKLLQDKERASGNTGIWGYVWQGAAYEGLTCVALEWVKAGGGGQIIEPGGAVSINNPRAAKALEMAANWVGTISPKGTLAYKEEDSRGLWQTGRAVFMRNWSYAYALGNTPDSPIKGKFGVAQLPAGGSAGASAATLGGWNLAVSKYSRQPGAAIALVKYLASAKAQKYRALANARLPTIKSLYEDREIAAKQPIIPRWKNVFLSAVPRPSMLTGKKYNEVSKEFWTAVHSTLSGRGSAARNLARLEVRLKRLKGRGW